jgi:Erythromycin esterase
MFGHFARSILWILVQRYYRIMYYGGAESWNLRDTHMFETLEHLARRKRSGARSARHLSIVRLLSMAIASSSSGSISMYCPLPTS